VLASNQEMEEVSFLDKLGSALYSMCTGIVLFCVLLGVAGWNEYRSVAMMKTISAGREALKQATCSIDSKLEGQLVHASCTLSKMKHLGQNIDGVKHMHANQTTGLSLHTTTEVFAWLESVEEKKTKNKVGGGDTIIKTYKYSQGWTSMTPKAVSSFYKAGEECMKANNNAPCTNIAPSTDADFTSAAAIANKLKLGTHIIDASTGVGFGAYTLPEDMTSKLGTAMPITPSCFPTRRALSPGTTTPTPAPPADGGLADEGARRRLLSETETTTTTAASETTTTTAASGGGATTTTTAASGGGTTTTTASGGGTTPTPTTAASGGGTTTTTASGGGTTPTPTLSPNGTTPTPTPSPSDSPSPSPSPDGGTTPTPTNSSTRISTPRPALCDHNATKTKCKDEVRVFLSHADAQFLSHTK